MADRSTGTFGKDVSETLPEYVAPDQSRSYQAKTGVFKTRNVEMVLKIESWTTSMPFYF